MKILWCIVFCTFPLLSCNRKDRYTPFRIKFAISARNKTVEEIHTWIGEGNYHIFDTKANNHIKGEIIFACLPADIRIKLLTENFFHDDGTTSNAFESETYFRALYLLAEYKTKEKQFLKIPSHIRFILSNKQIDVLTKVRLKCNNNYYGIAQHEELCYAYNNIAAMIAAHLLWYPKNPHHAYLDDEDMHVLKKIPLEFIDEMRLNKIHIGCMDDSSVCITKKLVDSLKKSVECFGPLLLKCMLDIGSIPYHLWNKNNMSGLATSLVFDGIFLYTHAVCVNNYSYTPQRLAFETVALSLRYGTIWKEPFWALTDFFIDHSYIPYLLATIPLAYYVRTNERFPHTFVLGEEKKENNSCTLL